MSDIYDKLRYKFDSMASGFPKTESGSEINLLKMLYDEKDAGIFIDMSQKPETPRQVAQRLQADENQLASDLERMAREGLLFRNRKEGKAYYSASPFVIGILEFQIKKITSDPNLAIAIGTYGMEGLLKSLTDVQDPHQRTIPINTDIVRKWPVAPFDDALAIIEQQSLIGLVDCTCRRLFNSMGLKGCQNEFDNCIGFGEMAEYYIENEFGREISKDEAIAIVKKSDEAGMVLQPFNGKNAGAICSCCGDCCAMLRSLSMNPGPAEAVKSSYYAVIETDECTGCEQCISRCQIDAIRMNDDEKAVIDLNRCIGCGLCVTTCLPEALQLIKKKDEDLYELPTDLDHAHEIMAFKRGFTV